MNVVITKTTQHITKLCSVGCVTLLLTLSFGLLADSKGYSLDSKLSRVVFATVKKQYVIEPAEFQKVSGSLSQSGKLTVIIDIGSVATGIDIRDSNLRQFFFKVAANKTATVSAQLDMKLVKKRGPVKRMTVPAQVTFYNKTASYQVDLLVTKGTGNRLVLTSVKPIIATMQDFGIEQSNLEKLAAQVGGIPVSGSVPVGFALVLKKAK